MKTVRSRTQSSPLVSLNDPLGNVRSTPIEIELVLSAYRTLRCWVDLDFGGGFHGQHH